MTALRSFRAPFAAAVWLAACSFTNSFDDIGDIQPMGGSGGGGTGNTGDGGADMGGMPSADGGSSMGGDPTGDGGTTTMPSGGEGGGPGIALPGLIVSAGFDADSAVSASQQDQVLVAMSPQTGEELNREVLEGTSTFVAIGYDGVRELWYLFKNTSSKVSPPAPTDTATFEIRTFDRATNEWHSEMDDPITVPTPALSTIAVLRDSVAYLAYHDGGTYDLVVLDTSDAAAPAEMGDSPRSMGTAVPEIVGTVGSGFGGTVNVVRPASCTPAVSCDLTLQKITIQAASIADNAPAETVATYTSPGNPVVGVNLSDTLNMVVYPDPPEDSGFGVLAQFNPSTHNPSGSTITFPTNATRFGQVSQDPCNGIAFVIELVTLSATPAIYAIPLDGAGTIGAETLSGDQLQGQHAIFEPVTRTVLSPFKHNASFGFPAYAIQGSADAPTFKKRNSDWAPAEDFAPIVTAVAQPIPVECE